MLLGLVDCDRIYLPAVDGFTPVLALRLISRVDGSEGGLDGAADGWNNLGGGLRNG